MGEDAEEGREVSKVSIKRLDARKDTLEFPVGDGKGVGLHHFAQRLEEAIVHTLVKVQVGTSEGEGAENCSGASAKCGVLTRRRWGREGDGFRPLSWSGSVCHTRHGGLKTVCS